MTVDHDLADVRVTQVWLERSVSEDLICHLTRDPGAVGHSQRRLVTLEHGAQGLDDLLFQVFLLEPRIIESGAQVFEQRLVHAALHRGERVRVLTVPAGLRTLLMDQRHGRGLLGEPLVEAHRPRLPTRRRGAGAADRSETGLSCRRSCAKRIMAWLTG